MFFWSEIHFMCPCSYLNVKEVLFVCLKVAFYENIGVGCWCPHALLQKVRSMCCWCSVRLVLMSGISEKCSFNHMRLKRLSASVFSSRIFGGLGVGAKLRPSFRTENSASERVWSERFKTLFSLNSLKALVSVLTKTFVEVSMLSVVELLLAGSDYVQSVKALEDIISNVSIRLQSSLAYIWVTQYIWSEWKPSCEYGDASFIWDCPDRSQLKAGFKRFESLVTKLSSSVSGLTMVKLILPFTVTEVCLGRPPNCSSCSWEREAGGIFC